MGESAVAMAAAGNLLIVAGHSSFPQPSNNSMQFWDGEPTQALAGEAFLYGAHLFPI